MRAPQLLSFLRPRGPQLSFTFSPRAEMSILAGHSVLDTVERAGQMLYISQVLGAPASWVAANVAGGAELAKSDAVIATFRIVGLLAFTTTAYAYTTRAWGTPAANKTCDLLPGVGWALLTLNLAANAEAFKPMVSRRTARAPAGMNRHIPTLWALNPHQTPPQF